VRIIAGDWRGRRIEVPDSEGLRPTPDRIRETLFNWLGQRLSGLRVLDCCAGAGALGLEAASRGAAEVTLVERSRRIAVHLREQCTMLGANQVKVVESDIVDFLNADASTYDLIFIDPPYAQAELREQILDLLCERDILSQDARIYLEWPKVQNTPLNCGDLTWVKQKTAGQVVYAIAQRQ
jgi:16S rRNA (guanine966-N2)-methyltransferase